LAAPLYRYACFVIVRIEAQYAVGGIGESLNSDVVDREDKVSGRK